jgi:AraC-like DNA-binding protein
MRSAPTNIGRIPRRGPYVLANAAHGVIERIGLMGGDPDRVFGQARIDPTWLVDPMNKIPLSGYCDLFEFAAIETRNDNFGLHFGSTFEPQQLGLIGYLAINAPTLNAGLSLMCEWFAVHQQDTTLCLRHTPEASFLEYQIKDGSVMRRRQDAELSMGIFTNIFRHSLGSRWEPLRIEFEHARPANSREHESVLHSSAYFGCETNAVVFRRSDLTALMPKADPILLATLVPLVRQHAAAHERRPDFLSTVKEVIREQMLAGRVSLRAAADALEISIWTLYRKLKECGTTFNELVKHTRQALAIDCVAQPHIPLTEVALMLGYSELSAFTRAFRCWTGVSPTQYRRQVRATN